MKNTPFLSHVAKFIKENHSTDLQNLIIVLPNHRAGIYLKHYLWTEFNCTIWSPRIITMDNLMEEISLLKPADSFNLLIDLYEIHKEIEGDEFKPFDEFISWGTILIQDFSEIDISLQDASRIFNYLTETKAMTLWNLDNRPLTEAQQKYLKFYNSLNLYYKQLKLKLNKKFIAYKGLIYRTAVDNLERFLQTNLNKLIFAGFNALTKSEETLVSHIKSAGYAELLWDCDEYYLDNKVNEAGFFLRKHMKRWNIRDINWKENLFINDSKNVNIINVASNVLQCKIAGDLITKFSPDEIESNETAVVLCDENLLFPTLTSIPESVKAVNVTMGYNYKSTAYFNLFSAIISLYEKSKEISTQSDSEECVYYLSLIELINNLHFCLPENDIKTLDSLERLKKRIVSLNQSFLNPSQIIAIIGKNNVVSGLVKVLFDEFNCIPSDIVLKLQHFLNHLANIFYNDEKFKTSFDKIHVEQILCSRKVLNRLFSIVNENKLSINIKSLYKIYTLLAQDEQISFYGEPLKGLQIMGMLETRGLDFKNIILLSVNENILPKAKSHNSFIPLDIKNEFALNTYKESDAVFAYHFYRLLTRAENIYLLYNCKSDSFNKGEKSRFITQLEYEWQKKNKNIKLTAYTPSINLIVPHKQKEISIRKDGVIIDKLLNIASTGISPSLLNVYRNCSLKFYFSRVVEIKETENFEETIAMNNLGSIMHEILHTLYKPYLNKQLNAGDYDNIFKIFDIKFDEAFLKRFQKSQIDKGKNYLIYMFAHKTLQDFLHKEKIIIKNLQSKNTNYQINALEQSYQSYLPVKSSIFKEHTQSIMLIGTIDRIDQEDCATRIIDYKSGSVTTKDLAINNVEDLTIDNCNDKLFQVIYYSYLFLKSSRKIVPNLSAGIISFKKLNQWFIPAKLGDDVNFFTKENLAIIEDRIINLLEEIFNPEIPFKQAKDKDSCKFCPYISLCKTLN